MTALTLSSESEEETEGLAKGLAPGLWPGSLIALRGSLGAGKTCFVRGLARGLGCPEGAVSSPTFTLINEYGGERLPLYHVDLYRLSPTVLDRESLREYLDSDGVCVVEWFDRLEEHGPRLDVEITFVEATRRLLVATAVGERYNQLLSRWRGDLPQASFVGR